MEQSPCCFPLECGVAVLTSSARNSPCLGRQACAMACEDRRQSVTPTFLAQGQQLRIPLTLLGKDSAAQLEAHIFQEPLAGQEELPLGGHQHVEGAVGDLPVLWHSIPSPPGTARLQPTTWPPSTGGTRIWASTGGAHLPRVRTAWSDAQKAGNRHPGGRVCWGCSPGWVSLRGRKGLWPSLAQGTLRAPPLSPHHQWDTQSHTW